MPAAMFHSGSSIGPSAGSADWMARYVEGINCMMPRAPTRLVAALSRSLSAIPCALNQRQSNAAPKYRFE